MAKNYPRLPTLIIFIVCAIAVTFFGYYTYAKNVSSKKMNSEGSIALESNTKNGESGKIADSNWQKQFFKENEKGINLKPSSAPNIKIKKDPTLTDEISQDLFTQFWQIHKSGLENDEKVMNSFSERFAGQVAAAANPILYSETDIKVTTATDDTSVGNYAKSIVNTLRNMPTSDAAIIANNALKEGNTGSLKDIDPIIKNYKSILNSLKTMSVPAYFSRQHLNLVNAISTMLFNAESLRRADVDPIKGLAAISIYVRGLELLSTSLGDLQAGFTSAGVVFTNASSSPKP